MVQTKELQLLNIINNLLDSIGVDTIDSLKAELSLRNDLEIDSISYAELIVLIEEAFDVNVNDDGRVDTIGQIKERLSID